MIHVIWIDDHNFKEDGITFSNECQSIVDRAWSDFGIDIEPFNSFIPALKVLQDNPSKWTAVILDVQNEKIGNGGVADDYITMRNKIVDLRREKCSEEPYTFVFSGIESYQQSELFELEPFHNRRVYAKPNEQTLLFQDIRTCADNSKNYELYKKYENIFAAIEHLDWSPSNQNELFSLLRIIDQEGNDKDHSSLNRIRKLIEAPIMAQFETSGLLRGLSTYLIEKNGSGWQDTLNGRSQFICRSSEVPVYVKRALHSITEITQNGSHNTADCSNVQIRTSRDIDSGDAPYVLKSCMYELLTIIIWQYIYKNQV